MIFGLTSEVLLIFSAPVFFRLFHSHGTNCKMDRKKGRIAFVKVAKKLALMTRPEFLEKNFSKQTGRKKKLCHWARFLLGVIGRHLKFTPDWSFYHRFMFENGKKTLLEVTNCSITGIWTKIQVG